MAFSLLLFTLLIIFIIEKRVKNWMTRPVIIFTYPTGLLIIIHKLFHSQLGQIEISDDVIYLTIIGFVLFWIGCLFFRFKQHVLNNNIININPPRISKQVYKIIFGVSIFCILIMLANLRSILNERNVMMVEDQEFANNGFSAHLSNLLSLSIIYFIGSIKINKLRLNPRIASVCLVISLFLKFLTAVKGELILPIIGGVILLFYYNKIQLTLKNIILISSVGAILFIAMGYVFNTSQDEVESSVMIDFFAYYLFSGITGLTGMLNNNYLVLGEYPLWIFRTTVNFLIKFFGSGDLDLESATEWVRVTTPNALFQHDSNVATLIGEIFMNCGYIFGAIILFILGWYSSYLYKKATTNLLYGLLYAYIGAALVLNFFSTYIIQPGFYEVQIMCFILIIINKKKTHDLYSSPFK